MELRPYQTEAVNAAMTDLIHNQFALIMAATGAGKTEIFCEIIRKWLHDFPSLRIAVVVHRRELVEQAYNRLILRAPNLSESVGMACASAGKVVSTKPVTVASVQTLVNHNDSIFHLLVIDEVHNMPHKERDGQFKKLITQMMDRYNQLRVLGVTATPYRVNHGYIYGKECRKGQTNWFPKQSYSIEMDTLTKQGFLVPIVAFEGESADLSDVHIVAGEYNAGELGEVMQRKVHLQAAWDVWSKEAVGRNKTLCFAVNIEHAKALGELFSEKGIPSRAVHSKMSKSERNEILDGFKSGEFNFLTNVGILTEGVDIPSVDCILLCRPTMSVSLYVQMLGRGTRLHPGKKDCLVLDLTGNCSKHGNPSSPYVAIPDPPKKKKTASVLSENALKRCPNCKMEVSIGAIECLDCGYVWEADTPTKMVKVDWSVNGTTAEGGIVALRLFKHLKGWSESLKVAITVGKKVVNTFFNMDGWGKTQFDSWWFQCGEGMPPNTIEEAINRIEQIKVDWVAIEKKGKYWKVTKWRRFKNKKNMK